MYFKLHIRAITSESFKMNIYMNKEFSQEFAMFLQGFARDF